MSSINNVTITGNLGRDPETKFLPSGVAITEFTVAVSDWFKPKEGEGKDITYWIRCKCWGKQGERLADWCKQGDAIMVTGKLVQEEWEDKETKKKQSKTLIQVENFVPGRKKQSAVNSAPLPPKSEKRPDPDLDAEDNGDAIPF